MSEKFFRPKKLNLIIDPSDLGVYFHTPIIVLCNVDTVLKVRVEIWKTVYLPTCLRDLINFICILVIWLVGGATKAATNSEMQTLPAAYLTRSSSSNSAQFLQLMVSIFMMSANELPCLVMTRMGQLRQVFNSDVGLRLKLHIYKTAVCPLFTYGSLMKKRWRT